jgi:hypothetical protein
MKKKYIKPDTSVIFASCGNDIMTDTFSVSSVLQDNNSRHR